MRFLAVTHQLTRTGAPVVLLSLIRLLISDGHSVDVISMEDGTLSSDFTELGITVTIQSTFASDFVTSKDYDYVICNTVETRTAVMALNGSNIPVIWWSHEPRQWFETFYDELPDPNTLQKNVKVLSVSPLTQDAYRDIYRYDTELFPFYVDDIAETILSNDTSSEKSAGRITRFISIGLFSYMKAPDVLAAAIPGLSPKELKSSEFIFCGDAEGSDPDFVDSVKQLEAALPMVRLQPTLPHNELLSLLSSCDYLVVPSRFDPMPTVAAEAMMLSIPTILSDGCGISRFTSGNEGFTFISESLSDLTTKLRRAIDFKRDRYAYRKMKEASRSTYGLFFTKGIFLDNFYGFLNMG